MAKAYILYNPLSGGGEIRDDLAIFEVILNDEPVFCDITEVGMPERVVNKLEEDDYIILCGGDGTLNRFVNDRVPLNIQNEIRYYPCGNQNDFAAEFRWEYGCNPFPVTEYLTQLPTATWEENPRYFLNGIGFGAQIPAGQKTARLCSEEPVGMCIFVDGKEYRFDKVWLGVTMYGTHWEGMIPAPQQNRCRNQLSFAVLHGCSRAHAAILLAALSRGFFPKHEKHLTVLSGSEITVTLDEPRPLRMDGETLPDLTSYTAYR